MNVAEMDAPKMDAVQSDAAKNFESPLPQQAAARRVVRLVRAVDGCSGALRLAVDAVAARHDLGATQLLALWACGDAPSGVVQSDLAEQVGISPPQASTLVEQLRRRGLIDSRRDATDRRRQLWTIANPGRRLLAAAIEGLAELARRVGDHLGQDEAERCADSLRRVAVAAVIRPVPGNVPGAVPDAVPDAARLRVVSPPSNDGVRCDNPPHRPITKRPREVRR